MPVELAIPRLSMSMTEAVLTAWLKPAGATVAVGDLLFTVESEKTAMEVESQAAGELVHVAEAGSTLEAGAVVGYVLAPGEGIESAPDHLGDTNLGDTILNSSELSIVSPKFSSPKLDERGGDWGSLGRPLATPIARRLARERGVDLAAVAGSGPRGRIQERDVPEARLASASLTLGADLDMDAVCALRAELAEDGVAPRDLDFIVAATARTLRDHPRLNAARAIAIGVSVALDDGLGARVLRDADRLSAHEICAAAGDMDGVDGTFTVSSLGHHGITWFTPILEPSQVAILGVGKVVDGVAWDDDGWMRRKRTVAVSLTVDSRTIDGVAAARFLAAVGEHLAAPRRLLEAG